MPTPRYTSGALLVIVSVALCQQKPKPVSDFRAETNLVLLDVQVLERSTGRVLGGLKASDFSVKDDDGPTEIVSFDGEASPLDTVLVLDVSGGVGRGLGLETYESVGEIVRELRPGDLLAVCSFSKEASVKTMLTDDEDAATKAIGAALRDRIDSSRHANIYNALLQASGAFGRQSAVRRRRAILLVTHNRERPDRRKIQAATTAVLESDATLQALVVPQVRYSSKPLISVGLPGIGSIGNDAPPKRIELPDLHSVDQIVVDTGGDLIRYDQRHDWRGAMARLRARYLLGIIGKPGNGDRRFRRVQVVLSADANARYPDAVIRSRTGYYTRPR